MSEPAHAQRRAGLPGELFDAIMAEALRAWAGREVACLVRIRKNLKVRILETLPDGSAVAEVKVPAVAGEPAAGLRLREIRAGGVGRDGRNFTLRLWTTLLDARLYPALVLARQYALRWEQEIYYRDLKLDVRSSSLLTSHTLETALQERAAPVLAMAVAAHVRVAAAQHLGVSPRRVSFPKTLLLTRQLWQTFAWSRRGRTARQTREIVDNFHESVEMMAILPARRARSCPLAVRQPVSSGPRKLDQPSRSGTVSLRIHCA